MAIQEIQMEEVRQVDRKFDIGLGKMAVGAANVLGALVSLDRGSWIVKGLGLAVAAASSYVFYQGNNALGEAVDYYEEAI